MHSPSAWLTKLKAHDLQKLAVRLGTPCSGTKAVQVAGIHNVLTHLQRADQRAELSKWSARDHISVVSIDMGIRNLAYSHWTASLLSSAKERPLQYTRPILEAWRKIDISTTPTETRSKSIRSETTSALVNDNGASEGTKLKESFEPTDYATRALNFIKSVLDEHNPSHVLIERQRFRTGGNSAVQEWTIRVGVFEGMLYAVLKALAEERQQLSTLSVEPVLPVRVNRYWLEDYCLHHKDAMTESAAKKTAKEVKQTKVRLVQRFLNEANTGSHDQLFTIGDEVADMVSAFVETGTKARKKRSSIEIKAKGKKQNHSEISKFDDLADCFLQGLAWMHWQNNRLKCETFKDATDSSSVAKDWLYSATT